MRHLYLDGRNWKSADDLYDAFFDAVHAPAWHGRNLNALRDSIAGGRINQIELPYVIHISGYATMKPEVRKTVDIFADLIRELSLAHDVGIELS
jgi:RNAse (barnase) inhibitor barstar